MSKPDIRDIMQDRAIPGLDQADRAEIRRLIGVVAAVFAAANTRPEVAYAVLLNVLGGLIGTRMADQKNSLIQRAQALLPLYVQSYVEKEKKI